MALSKSSSNGKRARQALSRAPSAEEEENGQLLTKVIELNWN